MSTSRPEQLRFIRENDERITMYSFPAKPLPHSIQMIFHKYDYSKYAASALLETGEGNGFISANPNLGLVPLGNTVEEMSTMSLELPFPRTLRDATGVSVAGFERDFLYERLASGIAGIANMSGADINSGLDSMLTAARNSGESVGKNGLGDTLVSAIQNFFGSNGNALSADTAKSVGAYLATKFLSGDLAKTASAVTGRVVNPQQTLAFEGVNLREFTFEWDLFPSNREDTEQITNIVNFLKQQMLPGTTGIAGAPGLEKAFLRYPSVVELSLLGVQEKHFMRFKRAMIDNVTVDYTGGGNQVSIIKGGVPASVTLSISFKELTIQTAEDYGAPPIEPIQTEVETQNNLSALDQEKAAALTRFRQTQNQRAPDSNATTTPSPTTPSLRPNPIIGVF